MNTMIKKMLGFPEQIAVNKLFSSAADIKTLTIYDIVLRVYSNTSALPWTNDAVADHLRGLIDTQRRPSLVNAALELLAVVGTVEEVAEQVVLFAKMAPEAARAALDGQFGRAIDLLRDPIRKDDRLSRREIYDLLAELSRFWVANDLRLIHRYIITRKAAPFGDAILDDEGLHLTRHYAFLRWIGLPIVRRTLRIYLNGSDNQVHRGPWTLVLRPLKKPGEWLMQHWGKRHGKNGLEARLRSAIWVTYHMLDELEDRLIKFSKSKKANNKSKLLQKSEQRDDYDGNQLLYLTSLFAVAWSQTGYDEDHNATGRAPLEEALAARRESSHAGTNITTSMPQPDLRHFSAARKLVAIARWADGIDKPALPTNLRTLIVNGVEHIVASQAEVEALRGKEYTLHELVKAILAEDPAPDSSASRGVNRLLDPSNPRTPGQQWLVDFAEGSLAWRIDARRGGAS